MIEGMAAGNVLLSSSILVSSSTYRKVACLADTLKLKFFSEQTFYNIQDKYLFPVINEFCHQEQNSVFPSLGRKICGFQGMGAVIALVIMRNMARTQGLTRKVTKLSIIMLFKLLK